MPENRLPHIIWQAAKFLVSLLEKEYGLGKKEIGTTDMVYKPQQRTRLAA